MWLMFIRVFASSKSWVKYFLPDLFGWNLPVLPLQSPVNTKFKTIVCSLHSTKFTRKIYKKLNIYFVCFSCKFRSSDCTLIAYFNFSMINYISHDYIFTLKFAVIRPYSLISIWRLGTRQQSIQLTFCMDSYWQAYEYGWRPKILNSREGGCVKIAFNGRQQLGTLHS